MNYSYQTSLIPYMENKSGKQRQCDYILSFIAKGADNLLRLSEITGITQAVVSARVNDLITDGKVSYLGFTDYRGRKRKKIVMANLQQSNLF